MQMKRDGVRRALLIAAASLAALLPLQTGCDGDRGTEFRDAALDSLQDGVTAILDGIVDGIFAIAEPESE